jgi:hypothetical protein
VPELEYLKPTGIPALCEVTIDCPNPLPAINHPTKHKQKQVLEDHMYKSLGLNFKQKLYRSINPRRIILRTPGLHIEISVPAHAKKQSSIGDQHREAEEPLIENFTKGSFVLRSQRMTRLSVPAVAK